MKNFLESRKNNESKDGVGFEKLESLRTEMNASIDTAFENIDNRAEAVSQIRRVFEHSINDGIRLGQQHGLTPDEWQTIVSDKTVVLKHREFMLHTAQNIRDLGLQADRNGIDYMKCIDITHDISNSWRRTKNLEKIEDKAIGREKDFPHIDSYYAEILSQSEKNLKPHTYEKKSDFTGTPNEKKAKEYLTGLKPWLKGQYYSKPILEKVYADIAADPNGKNYQNLLIQAYKSSDTNLNQEEFIKQSKTDKNLQEKITRHYLSSQSGDDNMQSKIQHQSLFDADVLEVIKQHVPTDMHDDFDKERRQKLDIVYTTGRRIVEQPLLKEVQEKVTQELGKDYIVVLDQNDTYSIKDNLEQKRIINDKDRIEFTNAFHKIDRFYKTVNEQEGFDYHPLNGWHNTIEYESLQKETEDLAELEYIESRAELLHPKDAIELIPNDATDQLVFSMLSNFKDELIKSGEYNFAMAKLDSLQTVPEKYIEELKDSFKNEYDKLESTSEPEIVEKTICSLNIYENIDSLTDIGGKLTFQAQLPDGNWTIIQDGQQISESYKYINSLTDIAGKPAFQVKLEDGSYIVIHDGKQIGESYKYIGSLTDIAGKLTFQAQLPDDNHAIIQDGKQIGESYQNIYSLTEIGGKPTFKTRLPDGKYAIIHDGQQISESYQDIESLTDIGGKLTFRAQLPDGNWTIIQDGQQISESYKNIYFPTDIGGKLIFVVGLPDGKEAIIQDGQQIGESYKNIYKIFERNGDLVLMLIDDNELKEITINLESLSPDYQESLDLLNIVHNPDLELIDDVIGDEILEPESFIDEMKKEFASSWHNAKFAAKQFKDNAREMLTFNSVKKTRAEYRTQQQLQQLLIPDVYAALKLQEQRRKSESMGNTIGSWFRGESSGTSSIEPQASDYLQSQLESVGYMGGNPNEQIGKETVVVNARHALKQEYLTTGYYAAESGGNWSKSYIPFDTAPSGTSRENTLTTAHITPGSRVKLPLPVHSSYIETRVKSIDTDGNETPVEITIDSLGQGFVTAPDNAEKITYSISESLINETPSAISEIEFQKTKKDIINQPSGEHYFTKISGLPDQEKLFIQSIESKTPKQKIQAIESYVRAIGYYDFDNNDEVVAPKRGADSEELFYLMEDCMNELRAQNPDRDYGNKRYAGVCDDYSKLTTALLRQAGIPSGIMHGFRAGGEKDITVGSAHGASFVLWRGPRGNISPYIIDGTPAGMNPEEQEKMAAMGINPETIEEKEQANKEIFQELREQAETEMKEVEQKLLELTPESIAELSNGKLENALNMVLAHDVSWKHVEAFESVLSAYRYTPLYKSLDSNIAQDFLQKQIESTNSTGEYAANHGGSAGSALFTMIKDFVNKENKKGADGIGDSEKITDLIKNSLLQNEHRSLVIINKYLKAKNILS